MTTVIRKATGRPTSVQAQLERLRQERTLPRDNRQLAAHFISLARSNDYEARRNAILRTLELLEREGTDRLIRVMDEAFADPRAGEEILDVIVYRLPKARELNLLATILSGIQFDRAQKALVPLLARQVLSLREGNILYSLYKKDHQLAVAILLSISNWGIWTHLLRYCFGNALSYRDTIGAQFIGEAYRRDPAPFLEVMLLLARQAKAAKKHDAYAYFDPIIDTLRGVPPEISAEAVNHLFQHEPETLARIIGRNTLFPSSELIQKLYAINKRAAIFALKAILMRHDVVRAAHIMALGSPDDPVEGLSKGEAGRKIADAASLLGQNPVAFMAKEAIEHAQNIERACGKNSQLLEDFLASLDPEEINARLLIYGLLIWETSGVYDRLGRDYDESAWRRINALRLLDSKTQSSRFFFHCCSEDRERLLERFVIRPQKQTREVELFTDVMAEIAEIAGVEYVAGLLDRIAEKHEEAAPFTQAVAFEIDRRRGAVN